MIDYKKELEKCESIIVDLEKQNKKLIKEYYADGTANKLMDVDNERKALQDYQVTLKDRIAFLEGEAEEFNRIIKDHEHCQFDNYDNSYCKECNESYPEHKEGCAINRIIILKKAQALGKEGDNV